MLKTGTAVRLWLKSAITSGSFGIVAGMLAYFGYFPTFIEDAVRIVGETIFDFIGLFSEGKSWNDTTATQAFGIGLTTFTLLLAPFRILLPYFWPEPPEILDSKLYREDTYPDDPLKADATLIGRDEEMKFLNRFAGPASGEDPAWISVTGPHGVGKSRLANAWLRLLYSHGWDVGYLSAIAMHDVESINRTRFRRKTAIVIDEFSLNTFGHECLHALLSKKQKIRILTLDQVSSMTLTNRDPKVAGRVTSRKAGNLNLPLLSHDQLQEISPEASETLIARADGRALYVLLGEDPIASIDVRLHERLSGKGEAAAAYLAFAALAAPVADVDRKAVFGRAFSVDERMRLHGAEEFSLKGNIVLPLMPAPLANRALVHWMALMGEGGWENIASEAARLNPTSFYQRLVSLCSERELYSQQTSQLAAIFAVQSPNYLAELKGRLEQDRQAVMTSTDGNDFLASLSRLHHFSQVFPGDAQAVFAFAQAAYKAVNYYGTAQDFVQLEVWGMRLVALAETPRWQDDQGIQAQLAKAVVDAVRHYGQAQDAPQVVAWSMRLITLAEAPRWQDDQVIQTQLAGAAVNAVSYYAIAQDAPKLEAWGMRLVALAEASFWQDDQKIQLRLANAAANAVRYYGLALDFAQLEVWGEQLVALAEAPLWQEDQEIQAQLASATVNAVSYYGTAQNFTRLKIWIARLIALAETPRWQEDQEIHVRLAMALVSTVNHFIQAQDSAQLEVWAMRLVTLAETSRWQEDQEIQRELAKAVVNAVNYYGTARDFVQLEVWGMRLVTLAETPRWQHDQNIQVTLTMAAINAVIHTHGEQFSAWKTILHRCASRNENNLEIRRHILNSGIVL